MPIRAGLATLAPANGQVPGGQWRHAKIVPLKGQQENFLYQPSPGAMVAINTAASCSRMGLINS